MTDHRDLQTRRDQAIRDLVDLQRQVAAGELSGSDAAGLRARYEAAAAAAIRALDDPSPAGQPATAATRSAGMRGRLGRLRTPHAVYAAGLATAVAAVFVVPTFVYGRPAGGFVTGNEAMQGAGNTSPMAMPSAGTAPRDLAKVTDKQMEAVVAANPTVVGMRLALARRYEAEQRYGRASLHYTTVLRQDPGNAEAAAHLGWILMLVGKPVRAASYVDRAVAEAPRQADALWFQANIRLFGLGDAKGALAVLDSLSGRRDLPTAVAGQVDRLRRVARTRITG